MNKMISDQLTAIKTFLNKSFFTALFYYFVFVAVFSLVAKLLTNFKPLIKLDVAIQQFIISQRIESLNYFLKLLTNLGDTKAMIALTVLVAIMLFWKKHYIYSIGIILSIGVTEFLSFIIKNAIGRHRPPDFIALVSEISPSFPSGHTVAAVSFYGFLIYFFYKNIRNKTLKNLLISICSFAIFLAGFTRIYLGVHWPSDTFASYILAGTWLVIIVILIEKYLKTFSHQ